MSRPSVWLMFAGTAGLLVGLVLLWQSTRSDALPLPDVQTTRQIARETAPPPPPTTTGPAARAGRRSAPIPMHVPAPSRTSDSAPAPQLAPESPPPASRENTKNLHFGGPQLRAQNAAVEPLVRACVEKAVTAGARPTGTAVMTYIVVAKRGEKVRVEDTSYDSDKTTLKNEGLVECLHQTAKAMKFEGLPREAEGLVVTRSITLENGAITEYKHVDFSYLR